MSSALNTLRELAQQDVDQATRALGHARQACQQAQQQLEMLLNYQDEYRKRLNQGMSGGIAAASWYNYQQFILTLEQAIEQHRAQLTQCHSRLEHATHSWQQKQQRLSAFSALHERAEVQRQIVLNKQDQKRMDEYAQRASQRREKS
ncbi:flagellar export protein FliJ [Edwardsiella piscicida]|uniref:flagellar export protein FliJ n=1 Tax=Edwardsiella piscicida TaxID=1263550 RepID=UPI0002C101FA|nr:flagellar export protein FliJ [Edwardsiella piscicida]AGH74156.1 Flagellar protein FliJ [Edwardsiella piscicida C07-087]AOP43378.1 flagella biosynthesis chaperone FliJ [Edwardsiella piscicida]EKS7765982.1 flagella biosynthesis chaperone FliJ [Edwardsiella piscicida]EKS7780932.1 flagella biosynthesis chaperone FliJ [Edwardsiella piscicida]EKS7783575.1 flagella biosynthesis chaperone FliJ [Edwardsiella piscicida]